MSDKNLEIAKKQTEIANYIGLGPDSVVYNFLKSGKHRRLNLITINPRHSQSFLFHTTEGSDDLDALREMLKYVKTFKQKESSYTIQWSAKGEDYLNTSYFHAKNILEALDKLFYDRDPNSINVFSVNLNPMT